MSANEQSQAFYEEISRVVDRFSSEFELPLTAAVGCLFMKANEIINNGIRQVENED